MKKTTLFILLVCFLKVSYSSTDSTLNFKNQVRISIGTHIVLANLSSEFNISYMSDNVQFGLPSLTYIRSASKNDYHEMSINDIYLKIGKLNPINTRKEFGVGLSYNYNVAFIRKRVTKIQPFIGFGSLMRYDRMNIQSFTSLDYPYSKNNISLQLICTPRVNFNIKNHWSIDVSIPFDLAGISSTITNNISPTIPISKRKTTSTIYSYFPTNMNIRVGVGYKF